MDYKYYSEDVIMMRVTVDLNTGLMIASCSCSTVKTMQDDALAHGFTNVQIKDVTDAEHAALIAACNMAQGVV